MTRRALFTLAALVALGGACKRKAASIDVVVPADAASPAPSASASNTPSPVASERVDSGTGCIVTSMDDSTTVTLVGRLVVDATFQGPNGPTRPYILKLDASRCVEGMDEPIKEVHAADYSDEKGKTTRLRPFVGKHVEIYGFPMEWHTGWHARPVVLMARTVRIAGPR
jgi:hypothetical protein